MPITVSPMRIPSFSPPQVPTRISRRAPQPARRLLRWAPRHEGPWRAAASAGVVDAFEALGPTYVKLGQIMAIREACKALGDFSLVGCAIYSSCEPCPMCLGAIYWARPAQVFYACDRADAAARLVKGCQGRDR